MNNHKKLLLISLSLFYFSLSVWSQAIVDPTTLNNKIMAGYQGWFAAGGDGSGYGWIHWSRRGETPNADNITIDMWPDMREYDADELFETNFVYPDLTPAELYSAYTRKTVERHVKWMKDYGIDGVFVQRFLGSTASRRDLRDTVLQNVRYGAEKYGRVFANMYDVSGGKTETMVEWIKNDWIHLVDDLKILESPNYLYHNGKPVLSIWGFGLSERPGTPTEAEEIIRWLTEEAPEKYKVTLKGGIDDKWQDHSSAWQSVYEMFDILSPWAVGRYGDIEGADNFRKNKIEPDLARTRNKNIDYIPVVFPGFSWYNLKEGTSELNRRPRIGGKFFWHQLYNAVDAGCNMIYVAMYDEVDEGTAIFKLAENEKQIPTTGKFVTLDIDGYKLPSDWYLRLTGEATKMLRGEINLTSTIPIAAYPDKSEFISQQVPTIMTPGATSTISVTLKNTGTTNWTKINNYKLAYSVDSTHNTWGILRVELEEDEIIEPGDIKTFAFEVTAPSLEGVYPFQWSLLQQEKGWIEDASELQLINVSANPIFLDDCDAINGWNSSGSLSLNTSDIKQGTGCIEFLGGIEATSEFQKILSVPYNSGLEVYDATLQFWYYISDASLAPGGITVNLGSDGSPGNNFYTWIQGDLVTGWNLVTLNVSDALITGVPDLDAINWLRISSVKSAPLSSRIDEIQLFDRYSGRTKYDLTVNSGRGSGRYVEDFFVTIIADEAPLGSVFTRWRVDNGNPLFENVYAPETKVRIRDMNIEITAEYKMFGQYLDDCDVMTGWGSSGPITLNTSDYKEGSGCIEFSGNQTEEFKKSFETPHNPGVSAEKGRLEFWYYVSDASRLGSNNQLELGSAGRNDQQEYNWKLTGLNNGWNFISVKFSNASITNSAPDLSAINWFRIYNFKSGAVVSRIDAIEIVDPDAGVKHPLVVQNGTGDGSFYNGSNINIAANPSPSGYVFNQWSIESGNPVISNIFTANTALTMGNGPAVIQANFLEEYYPLIVHNGTGDGNYSPGSVVNIQADQAPDGYTFGQWFIESGNPVIADMHASNTTLIMGNDSTSIYATFTVDHTGISRNRSMQDIRIFPNPGTHEFSVALSLENAANISISMQDLSGRFLQNIVLNQQIFPGNQVLSVPVSGIDPGTYILRISIDNTMNTRMVMIH
jgi:hypothetical protein